MCLQFAFTLITLFKLCSNINQWEIARTTTLQHNFLLGTEDNFRFYTACLTVVRRLSISMSISCQERFEIHCDFWTYTCITHINYGRDNCLHLSCRESTGQLQLQQRSGEKKVFIRLYSYFISSIWN